MVLSLLPVYLVVYSYFCCHPRLRLDVVSIVHMFIYFIFICCLWYVVLIYGCRHFWAAASWYYLEMLDKLQKRICRTVSASPALENLGSLPKCSQREFFSIGITLVDDYLNWFHFLIIEGALLVILIDCMIFLSSFLDVTRMFMLTVSFLSQLNSLILCL